MKRYLRRGLALLLAACLLLGMAGCTEKYYNGGKAVIAMESSTESEVDSAVSKINRILKEGTLEDLIAQLPKEAGEAEVNLTLTDNEGIHEINRMYRQIDAPTDVLSFPMLSYEQAGDFSALEEDYEDNFNPDTGEIMLGDIVISVDRVREQAAAYGHSERREFAFLIVHSMLHLFGYDHMTPEDAAVMEPKQRQILEEMNISRD